MYKTDTGYWIPSIGETIVLEESPHVVKWSGKNKEGKYIRGITIPHPYRDGMAEGTEYIVDGNFSAQDLHYEYILTKPKGQYFEEMGIEVLEIPLRYFKEHPTNVYENTWTPDK